MLVPLLRNSGERYAVVNSRAIEVCGETRRWTAWLSGSAALSSCVNHDDRVSLSHPASGIAAARAASCLSLRRRSVFIFFLRHAESSRDHGAHLVPRPAHDHLEEMHAHEEH